MLTVEIIYHADSRKMEIESVTSGRPDEGIATTGDDMMTRLHFTFDDGQGTLDGYSVRVEFGVNVIDGSSAYFPYIPLDESNGVVLPNSILSNVKCSVLPIQLAFTKIVDDEKTEFYSLNTLNLAINRALDAVAQIPVEHNPKVRDAIYDVDYDDSTATFTFTQIDGTHITIRLSDLSEEHFEVESENDLTGLSQAETGDTATVTITGIWYKLYGIYSNIDDWKVMSGNVTINGETTGSPVFYAPVDSGTAGQMLESQGEGNAPEWVDPPYAKKVEEWKVYADFSTSITIHHNLSDIPSSVMVFVEDDGDYNEVLADVVADKNTITVTFSQSPAYGTGIKIKALV